MTESPFTTISNIINEPSHLSDDLRIIAGSRRIDTPMRERIRLAADELEATEKAFVATQLRLMEAQRQLIALNERMIEAKKTAIAAQTFPRPMVWTQLVSGKFPMVSLFQQK